MKKACMMSALVTKDHDIRNKVMLHVILRFSIGGVTMCIDRYRYLKIGANGGINTYGFE